jgi:hypothetical protein
VAPLKAALIAAAPATFMGLRPIDGKTALVLADCPIIDDLLEGDLT